jgi:hypothetical protein
VQIQSLELREVEDVSLDSRQVVVRQVEPDEVLGAVHHIGEH